MIHLRLFETQAEFEAAKANLIKPWVSLTKENNHIDHSSSISSTEANIIMASLDGHQLHGQDLGNGEIEYFKYEYVGTYEYDGKEYYEYRLSFNGVSILAPTRNITKVTYPFDGYYIGKSDVVFSPMRLSDGLHSIYGFVEEPENKYIN